MNLPKQSRPVIREVGRDPIRTRVEGAQPPPTPCQRACALVEAPGSAAFNRCVWYCENGHW
jgi:hypothetical protein